MNTTEVQVALQTLGFPAAAYTIGMDRNETYCLVPSGAGWHVYYSERGNRNEERVFTVEDEACHDLLDRLHRDSSVQPGNG